MAWLIQARRRLPPPLLIVAALLCAGTNVASAQDSLETEVKATYLYKMAPFVSWPEGRAGAPDAFAICVIGTDPFGSLLDRAVTGQRAALRPIIIRRLAAASREMPCQIAFLGGSRDQGVKEALRILRGTPVLTVTDGPAAPGIVDFELIGGRVRFHIDDETAAESGLTISSKLLSLAVSVKPRKPSGFGP